MISGLVHTTTAAQQSLAEELQQAAEAYRARGFSVIPLAGKLPCVPWKEFQTRRASEMEIEAWFAGGDRRPTGIGIVTGKTSGLVVVDCDRPEDAAFWQENFPPTSVVVESGGGGRHFYYALPAAGEVRNRAGVLDRKIDIRGEGGFITAPPSLHRCGERYTFSACAWQERTKFEVEWLASSRQEPIAFTSTRDSQEIRHAVAYIHKIHAVAGAGGHNQTFRAACKLRDAGLSPEESLAVLAAWNATNADPPWSEAELRHKIASAFGRSK